MLIAPTRLGAGRVVVRPLGVALLVISMAMPVAAGPVSTLVTPRTWLRNSDVRYSQELAKALGVARLQQYVDNLNLGNRDLAERVPAGIRARDSLLAELAGLAPRDVAR